MQRQNEQVVEIKRVVFAQKLLVSLENGSGNRIDQTGRGKQIDGIHFVLDLGDFLEQRRRLDFLRIQVQFLHYIFDDAFGISPVENDESLANAGFLQSVLIPEQELQAEGMKGAYLNQPGERADKLLYAFGHFPRGLVGEGHRENTLGRRLFRSDKERDLVCENAGFSAPSTRENEQGAVAIGHCFPLTGVETFED